MHMAAYPCIMAKHTQRDLAWTVAMKRTHRDGRSITYRELEEMTGVSERTARDVLKTMSEKGVLRVKRDGNKVRYVGDWEET